jgi:di/tricarboxylate transporter
VTTDAWITLAVIALVLVTLVRGRVSPAAVVFGGAVAVMVLGVIEPDAAFSGFSNAAPITVAALYVLAAGIEKTGALTPIMQNTLGDRGLYRLPLVRTLVPTAGASAFLNNTPIVAMLAPQVAEWAERRNRPPSWYLMPISFAAMLGGTITVIGTSTNIVISGLLEATGHPPIGMFEISRVGVPVAIIGIGILIVISPIVLPDRRAARRQFEEEIREFAVAMEVDPGGALDGRTVEEAGLRNLSGVFLAEIERGGEIILPVPPTATLRGGDRLIFAGRVDQVVDLHTLRGLRSAEARHAVDLQRNDHTFFEAVVSGSSPLVGKTLSEIGFRARYQAVVLAIHRAGTRVHAKLGAVRLRAGDTLLLLADPSFGARWRERNDFLLVSHLGGSFPIPTAKAVLVGLVTFGIVAVAGIGLLPILHAAMLGALALVVFRVLTPDEARSAVDLDVIVVIAAAFALAAGLQNSGLAQLIGLGLVELLQPFGPLGLLLAVTLAATLLTELVTNNAAAALLFPVATATAAAAGLDPRPFAIAVAVAASASFLTPIGYQTNTMVYGPGGYRFGDYARLGVPLSIVVVLAIVTFSTGLGGGTINP